MKYTLQFITIFDTFIRQFLNYSDVKFQLLLKTEGFRFMKHEKHPRRCGAL